MSQKPASPPGLLPRAPAALGAAMRRAFDRWLLGVTYVGGVVRLFLATFTVGIPSFFGRSRALRRAELVSQCIRFGVRSIPIVMLVQLFIGVILSLNMAPVLESYGQLERVADIVGIAVVRELAPVITAVVLSGYAGASIAAELGSMVENEELKALRAHALDPLRVLVAPRILATTIMMVGLTILADAMGVFGGLLTAVFVLGISHDTYLDATAAALRLSDYWTGLAKGAVFGAIIASLACYEGLNVRGGASGVGRATTTTVVKSIVALIGADVIFTAVFYVLGW